MTDDDRDLLAGGALGALSADETRLLDELVARDRDAAAELEARRATVSALETAVARTLPPDDLVDRILAEVEPPALVTLPEPSAPAPRRRRRFMPRLAAAAALAVAGLALGIALFTGDGPGEAEARAAVAGTPQFVGVSGEARLYAPDEASGRLVLDLENVPPPPTGHHYQVWVLRNEGGGAMEAVGSFRPSAAQASLEFPLPGPGAYSAVDVSVEPDGGPPEHSTVSLAGGRFTS